MTESMHIESKKLAACIDHTCLKPDATQTIIETLCAEAVRFGFFSVCVNGRWVSLCSELLAGSSPAVGISAVCGFPLGAQSTVVKAFEAARAAEDGANEIDMVISVGSLLDGDTHSMSKDIRAVVAAVEGQAIVKAILETGLLTDEQIMIGCRVAEDAGAHYVKTSTGFGPGGANEHIVRLMRQSVSARIGVKASGGVRDYAAARRMIAAGAARIGTSSGIAIVQGCEEAGAY